MAYADDLLDLAVRLANLEPANPRQACLRRAASTAYYALFHLLISEAMLEVFKGLHAVAHAFIQAQQKREEADYDTGKE